MPKHLHLVGRNHFAFNFRRLAVVIAALFPGIVAQAAGLPVRLGVQASGIVPEGGQLAAFVQTNVVPMAYLQMLSGPRLDQTGLTGAFLAGGGACLDAWHWVPCVELLGGTLVGPGRRVVGEGQLNVVIRRYIGLNAAWQASAGIIASHAGDLKAHVAMGFATDVWTPS